MIEIGLTDPKKSGGGGGGGSLPLQPHRLRRSYRTSFRVSDSIEQQYTYSSKD